MIILKALKPVFVDGRIVEAGNKFSCSSDFSIKLIEGGSAELVKNSIKEKEIKVTTKKATGTKKEVAESDEL